MNPQAKKRGGMTFGGNKRGMRMGVGNPKTRRGKMAFFAKGGITYKDPDIGDSSAEARELGTEAIKSTARERDIMESAKGVPSLKEARPKTRGEAFKLARANKQKTFEWPPGSGNMYHTRTAEEEAARKPAAAAPQTEAPKPEASRAAAPSSAALLKARNEANVARERELMRNRKQPTATNAVRGPGECCPSGGNRSSVAAGRLRGTGVSLPYPGAGA